MIGRIDSLYYFATIKTMVTAKIKRGTVDLETGLVFWRRMKTAKNGEYWVSSEEYSRLKSKTYADTEKWAKTNQARVRDLAKTFLSRNPGYMAKAKARQRILRGPELLKISRDWVRNNPERAKAIRDRGREKRNAWKRNKIKVDPVASLKNRVRARIGHYMAKFGAVKNSAAIEILGCEWESLKSHLENQFTEGMNWENRGEWQVDHIIPLGSAQSVEEVLRLCHYSNLQPLWAEQNRRKWKHMPFSTMLIDATPETR